MAVCAPGWPWGCGCAAPPYLRIFSGLMSMLVLTGSWDPSQIGPNLLFNAVSCHLTTQSQPSSTFNQGCRLRKMFEGGSRDWDYLDMLKWCSQCWLNSRIAWGTCKNSGGSAHAPNSYISRGWDAGGCWRLESTLEAGIFTTESEVLLVVFSAFSN